MPQSNLPNSRTDSISQVELAHLPSQSLTRRRFGIIAASGLTILSRSARAADFSFRQYHNQPVESPLHKRLTQMWDSIRKETRGRVQATIFPLNNNMKDGDPDPLPMLVRGEIDFYTLAGNGLTGILPAADAQATPYAFKDAAQALRAMDGALGDYLREELKIKGIYMVPHACFDNGMHQITTASKPIRAAADLQGVKIRVPGSQMYHDFFRGFGAMTASMNINALQDALKSGRVEAQDDPFDVAELFRLYEVQKYMNVTRHSWSGYALLSNWKMWQGLPSDLQTVIEHNAQKYVRLQRADSAAADRRLRGELTHRGMVFIDPDIASFRAPLAAYYPKWKQWIGAKASSLLEAHVGKLGG